jgi:hypothetical protein
MKEVCRSWMRLISDKMLLKIRMLIANRENS